jgi:hypothetical protein
MAEGRIRSFFVEITKSKWQKTAGWIMLALLLAALLGWVDGKHAWFSGFIA